MKQKMNEFFLEFVLSKEILSIWPRRADSGQNRNNLFSIREICEPKRFSFVSKTISERLSFRFWHYYFSWPRSPLYPWVCDYEYGISIIIEEANFSEHPTERSIYQRILKDHTMWRDQIFGPPPTPPIQSPFLKDTFKDTFMNQVW